MPRRKPGTLLPLEAEILGVALSLLRSGQATFHGFGLAQAMREQGESRALTGHGTLYKALGRLEELGLLASRWEDAAAAEGRPRRRLYELTAQGARVATEAAAESARSTPTCTTTSHTNAPAASAIAGSPGASRLECSAVWPPTLPGETR